MFQKFIALGRLTKDPEMNPLADGTARARFTLAVDRRMSKEQKEKELAKGKDGKTADFFDCVVWRKLAENVCQFKKKGDMVLVEGVIKIDSYDDKEGVRRKSMQVVAISVVFAGNNGRKEETPWPDDAPFGGNDDEDAPF